MSDGSNLRGVARPAPHLRAALRLLHPGAHAVTLSDALDDERALSAITPLLGEALAAADRPMSREDIHLLAAKVLRATKEPSTMNQDRVNKLATEHYHPLHKEHAEATEVVAACSVIAAEELAKGNDAKHTLMGVRTRIHELLQSRVEVPNPELRATKDAGEMRAQLEEHHNHQTAHFQALWQHADALAERVMGGAS